MSAPHILPYQGKTPDIAADAFIAPGSHIIGDVTIGAHSSIWYNCVVRADVQRIVIGARSNIQDGSVIHVTSKTHGTFIGDDVLIGHMALIHGCTLEDRAFVGLGAIVMDGCVIGQEAMLAAGAMLTPGKHIPAGEMWAGRPAKFVRVLSAQERARNAKGTDSYVQVAAEHKAALAAHRTGS